ncbi:SDR family oxidoreductase [Oscillochloris sp. ZM17-4]|uniref:SDR family oxidoreductase n=1 Tax=Oscillochloris sp. ZM17-4 TaxID=2866714 RepID=UPI001C734B70|nr:SDR family oxidoreductase [Oscillochloris sp. ZM17-4]MBX0329981.1 SDR family oxidoreductase [Oscillochloris sp. ZM17-4]
MNVLFIGGTGLISTACTRLAVERGVELFLLNRGSRADIPEGATSIVADINDQSAVEAALAGRRFDVVVNWIAFTPDQVERDIALFRGRVGQYIFISSASAYQRPVGHYLVTESTPLANPYWDYSRNKIACEERLMRALREEGFPVTIVRPSLTYGDTQIPLAMNSWRLPYTIIARMRAGRPVVVPGDGSSLWPVTHNSDFAKGFVGLLGHQQATGHAFHITSDEALTWDQLYAATAAAAGAEAKIVHIASDFICACFPEMTGSLIGDKCSSVIFDNSKIRRFVPDYVATTPFKVGIARTLAWFDADPARQQVDAELDAQLDGLIAAYEQGLAGAVRQLRGA